MDTNMPYEMARPPSLLPNPVGVCLCDPLDTSLISHITWCFRQNGQSNVLIISQAKPIPSVGGDRLTIYHRLLASVGRGILVAIH